MPHLVRAGMLSRSKYVFEGRENITTMVVYITPVKPGVSRSFFKAISQSGPEAPPRVGFGLKLPKVLTGRLQANLIADAHCMTGCFSYGHMSGSS